MATVQFILPSGKFPDNQPAVSHVNVSLLFDKNYPGFAVPHHLWRPRPQLMTWPAFISPPMEWCKYLTSQSFFLLCNHLNYLWLFRRLKDSPQYKLAQDRGRGDGMLGGQLTVMVDSLSDQWNLLTSGVASRGSSACFLICEIGRSTCLSCGIWWEDSLNTHWRLQQSMWMRHMPDTKFKGELTFA